jgi:threonine/homoserine/homoserine lactone efflux protein
MTESLITMSIAGLLAGFIFSMPIAGPISILVTSNAFEGRSRYCNLVTIGASIADFIYVFIAIFGLTKFYSLYKPAIPYLLIAGALFLLYTGYKTIKTKIDLEHLELEDKQLSEKIKKKEKGGFYTGFMINFLNPTLFIGWLTSSFFMISFIASLGFNTGGLDTIIHQNVKEINNIVDKKIENPQVFSNIQLEKIRSRNREMQKKEPVSLPKHFHLLISTCYAFFLSVGSIIWFYLLAFVITRFRHRINIKIINGIVYSLGVLLGFIGIYFGYVAIRMLINAAQ